ncbi:MAG: DUF1549 domain-containing protein [Planctomycetes bacterium]|nr:DUF1549 domain-containing protein [Planctomycetota bacterium]
MVRRMKHRTSIWHWFFTAGVLTLLGAAAVRAEPTAEQIKFFENEVRPLLADNCYECHGPDKKRNGLRLDSLAGMINGGKNGPVIVPGDPDKSEMIRAIRHVDADLQMPKDKPKLSDAQIQTLVRWVKIGAPWPGAGPIRPGPQFTEQDRAWWAIQPVRKAEPPEMDDHGWSRNPIDRFVYQKLIDNGLTPAKSADRAALIRRVTFDLTGLPPTMAEIDAFVEDTSPNAYEKVVNRLLASPQYGERMARQWLDLVRYADSDGYRADGYRPDIWRYRDYVVRSFNADKPYDQFVREQIAGDEIAPDDPDALVATGYLRLGVYEWNQRDCYLQENTILDDITAVTSDVFLGLSMGCARCHNHKFDPILHEDYYRLRAFFEPVVWRDDVAPVTPAEKKKHDAKLAAWNEKTASLRAELEPLERKYDDKAAHTAVIKFTEELQAMWKKPEAERTPFEKQMCYLIGRQVDYERERVKWGDEDKKKRDEINAKLKEFDELKPGELPSAMTATDIGPSAPPTTIPGDKRNRVIEPGFISILDPEPAAIHPPSTGASTGRRTALANWIADAKNPLTARVIVNRIWQEHFGQGLVITPSELGKLGEPPSHPELLDWLAATFIEHNWSLKDLHRLIVLSATYQQTAERDTPDLAARIDPSNRLLWRMNTRRLEAEQVRDAILMVSGSLSEDMGGRSVSGNEPRRSLYVQNRRLTPDELLNAFDGADGLGSTPTRNVTTTASQALLMLNGDWPIKQAAALAERVSKAHPGDRAAQVDLAYRLAYGRSATTDERKIGVAFINQQTDVITDRKVKASTYVVKPFPGESTQAIVIRNGMAEDRFEVPYDPTLPSKELTVEAVVQLDSLYENAAVRIIASQWNGDNGEPGWSLGVTSEKSAYTPRNLIVQIVGQTGKGERKYEVLASGLHLELGRPYYVGFAFDPNDASAGGVTFYLRDLSDPTFEMQTAHVEHKVIGGYTSKSPLIVGGRNGRSSSGWDGLIDEVRISNRVLGADELLNASAHSRPDTVAYWRFENKPGVLKDESGHDRTLAPGYQGSDPHASDAALVDFCHVLLNSSEFVYVE